MQLIVDDGSRLMQQSTIDRLVRFVQNGGKLVLLPGSGERLITDATSSYPLLRALGYEDMSGVAVSHPEVAQLVFHRGNGIFTELTTLAVHDYRVLNAPKGGSILGLINGLPGAVQWPVGKGTVVLFGGSPGSLSSATALELAASPDARVRAGGSDIYGDAENELGQATLLLMRDLERWAKIPSLFTISGDFYGFLRQQGDTRRIYLYNSGDACTPVLRVPGSGKTRYTVTFESLTETIALGKVRADVLDAPGITLPQVKSGQTVMIQLTPVR
jgi:hypothetical protein